MQEFLLKTVFPLMGNFAVGGVGGFVAHFVAEPVLGLERLRREVRESIIFTANVGKDTKPEFYIPAYTELRRLGSRLDSLANVSWKPVTWWWKRQGYDLQRAVRGLFGLSNNLSDECGARAKFRNDIESGLRLPPS